MSDAPRKDQPKPFLVRLGWLVTIWAASVLALGVVAWVLRQLMSLAGMRA